VLLIGTMNTADRSIALVDAAMRRRFSFVALHPSEEPVRGLLGRWLAREQRDDLPARLLLALNERIEDPEFKVGPSYLMRPAVHLDGGLERVWRRAILPLLEEHHYGDGTDVGKRYGLSSLRTAVAPAPLTNASGEDAEGPQPAGDDADAG
jgi:5-methylcytosine-specific restriction protein B